MADERIPNIKLDVPYFMHEPQVHLKAIKWCEGHWAELMFALKDRNLDDQIADSPEELTRKFQNGELDPCWEACNMINMGALEIFGPDRILDENNGCPVCSFANIVPHVADLMARKYGQSH
jgi:urocanate hydratase